MTMVDPLLLACAAGGLLVFAVLALAMQARSDTKSRGSVRKRLDITPAEAKVEKRATPAMREKPSRAAQIAKRANQFYADNDPKSMRKMQMQLMQAGYLHENALALFIGARIGLSILMAVVALVATLVFFGGMSGTNKAVVIMVMALIGYLGPNFYVSRKVKKLQLENRSGFPDVMDLMIVAAEAGLTMEASIERIAHEVEKTYPTLSRQLTIASLEIRAGRPLDQALRAFGDRLGLEEVQGFATMIQQSKELGTSVSDALRVYSEEMRHKRMMAAEERAYALPAKLSIPVTAFILPVVVGVAILPTVVRMSM